MDIDKPLVYTFNPPDSVSKLSLYKEAARFESDKLKRRQSDKSEKIWQNKSEIEYALLS